MKYLTPSELEKLLQMKKTVRYFRKVANKIWGNCFVQKGIESDDLIAIIARSAPETDFIIVANDGDLFQLIRHNIECFHIGMNTLIGQGDYIRKFGWHPSYVIAMKCISGCTSDHIAGIGKVGIVGVTKFLQGHAEPVLVQRIADRIDIALERKRLIALPFESTRLPRLQPFTINEKALVRFCKKLGMPVQSFVKKVRQINGTM